MDGTLADWQDNLVITGDGALRLWVRRVLGRGLSSVDVPDPVRAVAEPTSSQHLDTRGVLLTICEYGLGSADAPAPGSALLLRLLAGYRLTDIAALAVTPVPAVREWLRVAGTELQQCLVEAPRTRARADEVPQAWRAAISGPSRGGILPQLQGVVARTPLPPCPPAEWYYGFYTPGAKGLPAETLAHLARCGPCQLLVAAHIGVDGPRLSEPAASGAAWMARPDEATSAVRDEVTQYFLSFRPAVYRYLRYCGYARTDAEDATQDAFVGLFRARLEGQHIKEPLAFVTALAKRRAVDRFRRQRVERVLFQELPRNLAETLPDAGQDCEADFAERQRRASFIRALQELSPLQRACVHWRAEGLSLRETADILGVTSKRVSQAYQRGIRRLRTIIDAF